MNIFIAGGTSGIGYSLALHYAGRGCRVGICGRDHSKIQEESSPALEIYEANVTNKASIETALHHFLAQTKTLNIFINCAGSYAEDIAGKISYTEAEEMLQTNILGTVNCFEIAREAMKGQSQGQIVVLASVSGILNYSGSSLYTKTKRAVMQIADAYRRALLPFGISVTTIAPGYVDTPNLRALNAGDLSKKPFLVSLEGATALITSAIETRKETLIFPAKMKWLMKSLSMLPPALLQLIMFKKAKWMKND